jgi:MFS family permease
MFRYARILSSPFLSLTILMLSVGFFLTYTSLRLKVEGFDPLVIGVISSGYYLGYLLGALRVERFITQLKHIRAFAAFASILTAVIMLQGMYIAPWAWFFARFISGFCIASLFVVIESWFLVVTPLIFRGRILAFYMVALYTSNAFSQYLIDIYDLDTLMPFLLNGLLCSLAIVPVTMTRTTVPDLPEAAPGMLLKIWKESPFGAASCLVSGGMLGCIYAFLPLFASSNQFSVANLMFTAIISGVIFQWPLGWLSDFFDRRKVILATAATIFFPAVIVSLFPHNFYVVFSMTFFASGLCFAIYPLGIAQVCDRIESVHLTTAAGVLLFSFGLGAVAGPLVVPFFIQVFPSAGLFVYLAFASLILSFIGVVSMTFTKSVPLEDQQKFVPVPSGFPAPLEE